MSGEDICVVLTSRFHQFYRSLIKTFSRKSMKWSEKSSVLVESALNDSHDGELNLFWLLDRWKTLWRKCSYQWVLKMRCSSVDVLVCLCLSHVVVTGQTDTCCCVLTQWRRCWWTCWTSAPTTSWCQKETTRVRVRGCDTFFISVLLTGSNKFKSLRMFQPSQLQTVYQSWWFQLLEEQPADT